MGSSSGIRRFEDLIVWEKAQNLGEDIYKLTTKGPISSDFSLKDQIRRAVLSISSNIAEGQGRFSKKEFRHYLAIANGSTYEVISLIHFTRKVGYLSQSDVKDILDKCSEVSRMLKGLRKSLDEKK
jgi:four helix bundle protein